MYKPCILADKAHIHLRLDDIWSCKWHNDIDQCSSNIRTDSPNMFHPHQLVFQYYIMCITSLSCICYNWQDIISISLTLMIVRSRSHIENRCFNHNRISSLSGTIGILLEKHCSIKRWCRKFGSCLI